MTKDAGNASYSAQPSLVQPQDKEKRERINYLVILREKTRTLRLEGIYYYF
jgi:hypothetical protein